MSDFPDLFESDEDFRGFLAATGHPVEDGMQPTLDDECNAAWAEVRKLRAERDELQAAIDEALSWMNDSAYVGGPSEREAWQKTLAVLGPLQTLHTAQGEGSR